MFTWKWFISRLQRKTGGNSTRLQRLRQEAIRVCIKMKGIQKTKQNKKQKDARDAPRFSNGLDLRKVLLRKSQRRLWNFYSEKKKNNDTRDTLKPGERAWAAAQRLMRSSPNQPALNFFPRWPTRMTLSLKHTEWYNKPNILN